ncbi:MAG: hypothetical protein IJ093_00235 [Bacilli bacterium]|nr:hypothetical protein [Bacilli bacterium]
MAILTNLIFLLLVGAIVIILALIGYLAEGTKLFKTTKKTKQEPAKQQPTPKPTPAIVGGSKIPVGVPVVTADWPVEVLNIKDTLWSDDAPKPDPNQTVVHEVPKDDDWTTMPETPSQQGEVNTEENLKEIYENTDGTMFPDITVEDFETPTEPENNKDSESSETIWS